MDNNYVLLLVEGKNINNFLRWLIFSNINIFDLDIVNHKKAYIKVKRKYISQIIKYSKTYKITIIRNYGCLMIVDFIKKYYLILLSLLFSVFLVFLYSKIIFDVEINYNDKKLNEIIKKELKKYEIERFKFKKDSLYLKNVKKNILKDNKDIIEWIEIEELGTKYIIHLVERKQESLEEESGYKSIVAAKNGTIKKIVAYKGEKVKNVNDYIKKDEVIISGAFPKTNNDIFYTNAKGYVLAEIWYKIKVEYPLYYYESKPTNKIKEVPIMNIFSKKYYLWPYKEYKNYNNYSQKIINNNFLPISIGKEKIYELKISEKIYTYDEALEKAIIEAKNKLVKSNIKIKSVDEVMVLNKEIVGNKICIELFISVLEDITKYNNIIMDIGQLG